MRVLVVGGSGFVGSHVVDKLRDHDFEVCVFDRVPALRDDVDFVLGDVQDAAAVRDAVRDVDAVFHLAAVADVAEVHKDPALAEAINVRGTLNVLEAVRSSGRQQRVFYASTTWVYGNCSVEQVDEETNLGPPDHFYTATKLAGEYYCRSYSQLYDVPVTILRYGIPYGPRSRDAAVIPIFVRKAMEGEAIILAGGGNQFRKFVYVEDLAEGNVLALKSPSNDRVYNLDGSKQVTIKQVALTIQELLGPITIEETPARLGDFPGKDVSSSRALAELGWKPRITFLEGVRRYIDWQRSRRGAEGTEQHRNGAG